MRLPFDTVAMLIFAQGSEVVHSICSTFPLPLAISSGASAEPYDSFQVQVDII